MVCGDEQNGKTANLQNGRTPLFKVKNGMIGFMLTLR
jgi:hypothetical protein